jgi:Tfp pilus assembly protein PilX
MKHKKAILKNERGIVLVLSIFMMALLTMIGMAAMMTSTTEIDIAANEKFHKLTFYHAETGLTIGAEIVEVQGGYDSVMDDSFYDDNDTIKATDGEFLFEAKDVPPGTGIWARDNQTDCVCIDINNDGVCDDTSMTCADNTPDIRISGSFVGDNEYLANMDIDVDKTGVRYLAGGGAEFGSGAEGIGVASHRVIYNIHCIGKLPENPSIYAEHIWGFQFIPRF